MSPGDTLPLRRIHSDEAMEAGVGRLSLEYWRTRPTEDIIESLRLGELEALRVKPDGRVMNGNTRVKVLEERSVDADELPREIAP